MASPVTILLPEREPESSRDDGVEQETPSQTASRCLRENHELHHMFFNGEGFHNHISHALLTLWSLGASSSEIHSAYDNNKIFQRPQMPVQHDPDRDLTDPQQFLRYMSDEKYYKAFLDLFVQEMIDSSWQEVLQRYVFAGDQRADAMLVRLFDSFLHPLIHLGFGVEFDQPAIIAEALAQTACHQPSVADLLLSAERAASHSPSKKIVDVLDAIQDDTEIVQAPRWTDHDKIVDGVIARAEPAMITHLAHIQIENTGRESLHRKTAEMINAAAYLTACAQRPGKAIKFDFYLIHCLTSAIFFDTFLKQEWLSGQNKVRLLTFKIRMDLVMYASRKSPRLHIDRVRSYKTGRESSWEEIGKRVCRVPDDGHASKVIRSIVKGRVVCEGYENDDAFRIKDDDWHRIALMAIDSFDAVARPDGKVQFDGPGEAWVRSAGFDEAWASVPDLVSDK